MFEISSKISKDLFLCYNGKDFFVDNKEKKYSDSYDFGINLIKIFELCYIPFEFENQKLNDILKSYKECKIQTDDFELYELIHENIFFEITKSKLKKMFSNLLLLNEKQEFKNACIYYEKFGKNQYNLLRSIEKNHICLSDGRKIKIKYNDTRTGRLSCEGEINIYNLPIKKRQNIISCDNFHLLKMDYTACQIRLFFYITQNELYKEKDPYLKISEVLNCSRDVAKKVSIEKLFGAQKNTILKSISSKQYEKLCEILNTNNIKIDYDFMFDIFNRPIKIFSNDKTTIINNLLQSIERNVLLNSLYEIDKYIKEKKLQIKILFPFHDAAIIMIHDKCFEEVKKIKDIFENSFFGCKMFSKAKVGKNFKEIT